MITGLAVSVTTYPVPQAWHCTWAPVSPTGGPSTEGTGVSGSGDAVVSGGAGGGEAGMASGDPGPFWGYRGSPGDDSEGIGGSPGMSNKALRGESGGSKVIGSIPIGGADGSGMCAIVDNGSLMASANETGDSDAGGRDNRFMSCIPRSVENVGKR